MHHPDLQMSTHATMRRFERAFNLPSRGFVVLKYSFEYTGKTARLIQMMPHCSLWIVAGSPGYLCWSIIIICVTVSECDGPNCGSLGYSPSRCTVWIFQTFGPLYRMKRGSAVSTFYINSPTVDSYLVGSPLCLSWLQWQQRVKTSNENR